MSIVRTTLRMLPALLPGLTGLILFCGCASTEIEEVNTAILSRRTSLSNRKSLAKLTGTALSRPTKGDYRVGGRDVLDVSIFELETRNETFTAAVRVADTGTIALPVLGDIEVAGLTVTEIRKHLEKRLKDGEILKLPRVNVGVQQYGSKKIAVFGTVRTPGVYALQHNSMSLLEALAQAGGLTERSGQVCHIMRHTPSTTTETEKLVTAEPDDAKTIQVDLYELLELGDLTLNIELQPGDVVSIPEARSFYVIGFVRESGSFPLNRPVTVLQGIALAHGLAAGKASPRACVLKRRSPGGTVNLPIDLVAISRGTTPDPFLLPDDVIEVRQTGGKRFWVAFADLFKGIFGVGYSLN